MINVKYIVKLIINFAKKIETKFEYISTKSTVKFATS